MPLAGSVATINYSAHPQPFTQYFHMIHPNTCASEVHKCPQEAAQAYTHPTPSTCMHTRVERCNFRRLLTETYPVPMRCSLLITLPLSPSPALCPLQSTPPSPINSFIQCFSVHVSSPGCPSFCCDTLYCDQANHRH